MSSVMMAEHVELPALDDAEIEGMLDDLVKSESGESSPRRWIKALPDAVGLSPSREHDSRVTPLRSTRAHKVSDEERRARHRAVQRRFMQRKKQTIEQAKTVIEELRKRYELLCLRAEERQLRSEGEDLAARVAVPRAVPLLSRDQICAMLDEQMDAVQACYEPLTFDEWTRIQQRNIADHEVQMLDPTYATTGAKVMGWTDRRKMDHSSVSFMLSKEFPNVRACELWVATWKRMISPELHASFFSPAFVIRMRVLQHISDHAVVIYRTLFNPQTGATSHTIETVSRERIGSDYVITGRSLDRNAAQACFGEAFTTLHISASFTFTPAPDGQRGCVYRHGGGLRNFVATHVRYWLMEMFFMALRFEGMMVAPMFALPD
ncbi:hypothetical protein ATCC90586_003157 [Pythium insidiosum]|nr:hypothetical protein ATCC90586_003157 [Pythium insidiosum]